jgi:membrane fusion protein (multidrug efflux system)
MAAARDQAARIIRPEPDTAEATFVRDASAADSPRSHSSEETVARRPAETPDQPAIDKPGSAPAAAAQSAAPKSGKRKVVLLGIGALLAPPPPRPTACIMFWSDAFLVSTDDAYVRANSTTLGAGCLAISRQFFPATTSWSAPAT